MAPPENQLQSTQRAQRKLRIIFANFAFFAISLEINREYYATELQTRQ
jgi:hypothetical protein